MVRQIPTPSGNYYVGFTDIINKYGKDRLLMRLYYPTEAKYNQDSLIQWAEDYEYIKGLASFFGLPKLSFIVNWFTSDLYLPASRDVPLINTSQSLPVTLFSHGLGGNRFIYSSTCIELASHGLVVAAVEHSDLSASATYYLNSDHTKSWIEFRKNVGKLPNPFEIRNNQVKHRAKECSDTLTYLQMINNGTAEVVQSDVCLDNWKERLDVDRCAIIGHSFGGATAVATIAEDERFKVAVGLDVWTYPLHKEIYSQLERKIPVLFINSEGFHWKENISDILKIQTLDNEREMVTVKGTIHQSQSDASFLVNSNVLSKLFKLNGEMNAEEASRTNNLLSMSYLSRYLGFPFSKDFKQVLNDTESVFRGTNVKMD